MVAFAVGIGGVVGALLSGGFIWWEVGRFAVPQVPITLFDERKVLAAYTVGLFVGVPLATAYLLFVVSLTNGALVGALAFLLGLVGGAELAQWLVLRSTYWGGSARPFYALALRAGIGGILALSVVSTYLGVPSPSPTGLLPAVLGSLAVVGLEVAGALVSFPPEGTGPQATGRPLAGLLFGTVGFLLLGLGALAGPEGSLAGGAVAFFGAVLVYRRLRPGLEGIPPPGGRPPRSTGEGSPIYGRTSPGGSEARTGEIVSP